MSVDELISRDSAKESLQRRLGIESFTAASCVITCLVAADLGSV